MSSTSTLKILSAVQAETRRARELHAPFGTAHHGYAVLLEELDELWDEVKKRKPNKRRMYEEAIQVAAMAVLFAKELCED